MAGLVKAPLHNVIVEGIYNGILTQSAQYYYFLGRTTPWTVADGASPGEDGVWEQQGAITVLNAPPPLPTFRYELDTRNNSIGYKLIKSSDVAMVIPRHNWVSGTVYDMYDDAISIANPTASGATSLEDSQFYVLSSLNNVYKCISNNYGAPSTVQPSGTAVTNITTADGYIWKFMYDIPVALQNKFYTHDFMPVMTSLRRRFYENGAIADVSIIDPGSGYTSGVSLAISGDGFLEDNPYAVGSTCIVSDGGAGYKDTIVATASWLAGVVTFASTGHGYLGGESITVRGSSNPLFDGDYVTVYNDVNNFDVVLVADPGAAATGCNVSLGVLTFSVPLWGATPTITTAHATITAGIITNIDCDLQTVAAQSVYGYGYDQTGTVAIDTPFTEDALWSANATYLLNDTVKANNNYYNVSVAGTVNTTLPIHLSGAITFGTAELTYLGTDSTASMILSKTEAIMVPIMEGVSPNQYFTGVSIVNGGVGYTYCTITPVDSPLNSSAILVPDISIGLIDTIQADVELEALQAPGGISYIKLERDALTDILQTGSGYGPETTVTVSGDGTGCTAVPDIVGGSIVGITITNAGSGYTREADVLILPEKLDGGGAYIGAVARAILSPFGGHGSNAISEFNAKTLLFYSALGDERVHKIPNYNDYRQFGVVRNPKSYLTGSRVSATSVSSTWLINSDATININEFEIDDELYQGGDESFRIIAIRDTDVVVLSTTGIAPVAGTFINKNLVRVGNTFSGIGVTAPQVDKFSGDIIFIDNKLPFVVTADQTITFRTTLGF